MTLPRKFITPFQTLVLWIGCLLCLGPANIRAFHIIGGEITYQCLGDGAPGTKNYAFVMTIYRDCAGLGAQFDNPAEVGVYRYINGNYAFVRAFQISHTPITSVPPPDDPCLVIPANVCVQAAAYHFNLNDLEVIDGSYFIFWRRCCRNITINNIVDPSNVGATFSVEITARAQQLCNNSPTFDSFPPTVICVNQPLMYDHSATDAEGDQLVYEFCAPLVGGGPAGGQGGSGGADRSCNGIRPDPANCPPPFPPVSFVGPTYTAVQPLAGTPAVNINANTGMITGTPRILGQFVVGVCVKEYRNGELLSVLQRDFQFNVSTCENLIVALVESDTIIPQEVFVINSCGSNTLDLVNLSQPGSVVTYDWEFDLGGQIATADTRHATVTFPGLGSYDGLMILNKNLTCTDTAILRINIYPGINSDFDFDYDTCRGAPVDFTDKSFSGSGQLTNWFWDFGDNHISQARNPKHLYTIPGDHEVTLRVRDINQCEHELTKVISYFPVPPYIIIEPSTFNGCTPANVLFTNLSTPIDETYDIVWDFGDGSQSFEISPQHLYKEPGLYSLHVEITSPIGCFVEADFDNWINIRPSPGAGFSFSPTVLSNFNSRVVFSDESVHASAWQWAFGDESIAFIQNPVYTFVDTGLQFIRQVVFHENGCTDTATAIIDVVPEVRYYLPNAFTPNFDSKNDVYKGVGVLDGMTDFEMSIWSRWGARVFHTSDPHQSWNGRMDNSGDDLPTGVYVCVVRYLDPRNNPVEIKEFATLIR